MSGIFCLARRSHYTHSSTIISLLNRDSPMKSVMLRLSAAFALAVTFMLPSMAHAVPRIDITSGTFKPMPIALTDPTSGDATAAGLGRDIMRVVAADLERSGLFRPIDRGAFIEQISSGSAIPRFADWRQISAQALVTASIDIRGDNVVIAFRLWDVYGEQQMSGKEFNTFRSNWRRVGHLVADEIYKRLTGEDGYFDSRVVYVSESGPAKKKVKRLAIMDQDGENHKFLTDGGNIVLTPRFSPDSQEILYMAYAARQPRVFLRDLQSGREEMLGKFDGMSFAPRFAASGEKMVMSIARNGVTDIHDMDLRSRSMRKLTSGSAINTSPSYSPDGKFITFTSDRGGKQQLYVMRADGSGVQRISFGDGSYSTPVWSPRGDWIAFTKQKGGMFHIGVMRPDGSGERLLTQSYMDEGPTWSPNGRVIIFTRQAPGGRSRLYSVDITGHNLREMLTPSDASDPAWSPLLPL
jgi:TolB protein